jgi:hypothetical protein
MVLLSQGTGHSFGLLHLGRETLPEWPEPMHVFASPELKITLTDGTTTTLLSSALPQGHLSGQ